MLVDSDSTSLVLCARRLFITRLSPHVKKTTTTPSTLETRHLYSLRVITHNHISNGEFFCPTLDGGSFHYLVTFYCPIRNSH